MMFLIFVPIIAIVCAFIYINFIFPKKLEKENKEENNISKGKNTK